MGMLLQTRMRLVCCPVEVHHLLLVQHAAKSATHELSVCSVLLTGTVPRCQQQSSVPYSDHVRSPDALHLLTCARLKQMCSLCLQAKVAMCALAKGEDMAGVALAVVKRAYSALSKDDIAVLAFRLGSDDARTPPISARPPAANPPPRIAAPAAIPSLPQAPVTPPPSAVAVPDAPFAAGMLCSERPAAGLCSAKTDAAGRGAGTPRGSPSCCHHGLYSRVASREAATGAATDHGSCMETPRTNDAASCNDEEVSGEEGTPVFLPRGTCGWRFGSAVRWGVLLAAAVAGIAVCACRRRR